MTLGRLLLRNLLFHWRGNLAIFLGVAVGSAVLTGALLVGDSLRGSLRDLTEQQLGWVDQALVGPRFLREQLADDLGAKQAAPAILVRGAASAVSPTTGKPIRRVGQAAILGVDDRFWRGEVPVDASFWQSTDNDAVLNAALASELGVRAGDTVALSVQKVSAVPRETLLGRRDVGDVLDELHLKVRAVLPNDRPGSSFSLSPGALQPRNAFVPLRTLQAKLTQQQRVNALLVEGGEPAALQAALRRRLLLEDWGLVLHDPESRTRALFEKLDRNRDDRLSAGEWRRRIADTFRQAADQNGDRELERAEVLTLYQQLHPYLSVESRQMILEPAVAAAALEAAKEAGLRAAPTLVYLANGISDGKQTIPYSVVAALDPTLAVPLGPFLPAGVDRLRDDEIVLADWKESPLTAQPGDTITLTYFVPEGQGRLTEASARFRLRGRIPLQGVANDPHLTPEFPGITDKLDLRNWDPPFPYDNQRVQPRDEHYWEEYRTTPKAYVTLAAGQRLWGSRFGDLTSIRLAPAANDLTSDLGKVAADFRRRLLTHLQPEQGGLVFDAVRERGLLSSSGSTDFGGLFLGFSFFLIAAALLLVGLLFRLNLDRRAEEIGLLLATGYRRATLRRLLLAEGSLLAVGGGLVGLAGAVLYAWLLLELFRAWWPGTLDRSFLRLHVTLMSMLIGYVAALIVSVLTILWALRILGRIAPGALLAGETTAAPEAGDAARTPRWSRWIAGLATIGALVLIAAGSRMQDDHEMQAMTFFGSGFLLLAASLAASWAWMRSTRQRRVGGHGSRAVARLGVRNASRNPVRSLLTAGLLASATFLVVAVESFHRAPGHDFLDRNSGSGGFALMAESAVPIYQDLNTPAGRDELNFPEQARTLLEGVTFYACRLRAGDDASCLNFYQPRRPRLVGVPHDLIERGGFQFGKSEAPSPEAEPANPWLLLNQAYPDGPIPIFGDANTVMWILHTGLGKSIEVPDERGKPEALRIVGLLQSSIFQSELLLSEANFLKLYPRQEGYQFFLIQVPPERAAEVRALLETTLADYGFVVTSTVERLQAYLAVENTYLATFQALGGLGLLLGALGLAVVLLRSVWERRGELALLRALGFRNAVLGWLVFAENSFLLLLGMGAGLVTALLAVAPHLTGGAGAVPWLRLLGLLALVLVVGLAAGAAAVAATLRAPLLPALRRE